MILTKIILTIFILAFCVWWIYAMWKCWEVVESEHKSEVELPKTFGKKIIEYWIEIKNEQQ